MILGAEVPTREHQDQRIAPLQLAEFAARARMVGQFVVGKTGSRNNISSHVFLPPRGVGVARQKSYTALCRISVRVGTRGPVHTQIRASQVDPHWQPPRPPSPDRPHPHPPTPTLPP